RKAKTDHFARNPKSGPQRKSPQIVAPRTRASCQRPSGGLVRVAALPFGTLGRQHFELGGNPGAPETIRTSDLCLRSNLSCLSLQRESARHVTISYCNY